jgi:hypothetical protein
VVRRGSHTRALAVPLLAALLCYAFWRSPLLLPLKLFTVFLHEASHGLAALVSGGSIERIEISANEGGVCWTRGGWRFLVASAGYLGSLGFGLLFLWLGTRSRADRALVAMAGAATLFLTLAYVRSLFGLAYGVLAGLALLAVAVWLPADASDVLLRVLGTVSALYAVWDIASDVLLRSVPGSDAHALAELTGLPALLWGLLWAALSVALLALVLRSAARLDQSDGQP